MNIYRTISLLAALHYLLHTGHAQEIKGDDAQENLLKVGSTGVQIGVVRKFDNRYEGVKGSPFYVDVWLQGSITTIDGLQQDFAEMKYNAYEDEVIVQKGRTGQFYFPKHQIKSFSLLDRQSGKTKMFVLHRHFKRSEDSQFYRILSQGKTNVVEHSKVVFEKADFEGGYSNDKRYDEFKHYKDLYYFSKSDPEPKKLKRTAKSISGIDPDHSKEIRSFISDNGYDCRNESDLLKILDHIQNIE